MAQNKFDPCENAGRNFKKLLKDNGYTQADFSDDFGVAIRTIRNWTHRIVDMETLMQIADFFDVSLEDLIFSKED